MKKIIAVLIAVASFPTFAATAVCAGSKESTSVTVNVTTDMFIVNSFSQKCSANVHLAYAEDAINIAVGSGSVKGKNVFAGTSAGGSVSPTGTTCDATTGCTATQAADAADAKLAAGSGS